MSDIELTNKQHNKIKRAVKALNDVRAEVQQENPDNDVNWYLEDGGNLNLLSDKSHDGFNGADANHHHIMSTYTMDNAGGGGW